MVVTLPIRKLSLPHQNEFVDAPLARTMSDPPYQQSIIQLKGQLKGQTNEILNFEG